MATTSVGALARIAGRDALRPRRHSLLLVAMIALPVAGLVAGTTLLDTLWQRPGSDWIRMWGSLVVVAFWTLSAITLVAAVLMAGAAVTIAARRQLRALGLLAAAGARGRQLGVVVLLQAATLGLVGVLVGVPAGLLLARALLPRLARAIYLPIYEPAVPPLLVAPGRLLLAGGLGLLAAVVAALLPAVRAARLPVTQALAAQQPLPSHPRWLTIAGILLVLLGLGLVVLQVWLLGSPWQPWAALATVAALPVGVVALSPALVALLGRTARRLPATGRLAVRDLARHRTRSAAAVAAVTAGLAVPMLLGVMAAQSASWQDYAPRELRADQVLVNSPAAVAAVTKLLPGARQAPFTTAKDAGGREATVHGPVINQPDIGVNRSLAIGEQELLVAMGGEQATAAFAGGAVVAFGPGLVPDGQVSLAITDFPRPSRHISLPAVEVTTGSYMGQTLPSFVISRQTAQRLGLPGLTTPPRYLIRAAGPLSDAQRDQLRGLQTDLDVAISWAEPDPDQQHFEQGMRSIVLALLPVAGMIALGSVAAACALALSEARQDLTTLGQLGATPAMTQRLMVAEAWLLATLGALLAVAIGLGPAAVQTLASWHVRPRLAVPTYPSPLAVPWTLLAVVSLGIPALAAAAASLLGRSPAPLAPRRGG
jgi:putative ABC transport system permease protein